MNDRRRELPSVDRLLHDPAVEALLLTTPRAAVVAAIRETIASARTRRGGPPDDWAVEIRERLTDRRRPGLRPVLNATGVVLHTNLGRAPLAQAAIQAVTAVAVPITAATCCAGSPARRTRWWSTTRRAPWCWRSTLWPPGATS
jgi:L-seryl-tRNA(Ser) seleniumtransferase